MSVPQPADLPIEGGWRQIDGVWTWSNDTSLVPLGRDDVALMEAQAHKRGLVPLEALVEAQAGYGPRDQLGSNEYEDPEWAEAFSNRLYDDPDWSDYE